jgi:GH24 family phage-related lysozyme (muramidase)
MSRKISAAGLQLIKNFEGCRLTAYKPVPTEQYWTIGWGHYGPDVKQGSTITQAQADAMLAGDMGKYEAYANDVAYVPVTAKLTQNQFDALVSFCYNCGQGNLKALCKGRTVEQIAEHITQYNKSSGTVLAGLVRRREAELKLFRSQEVGQQPTNTKDVEKLELSNYQWDILKTGVKSLLNRKVITDQAWQEKVNKKILTVSELSWLNFVISTK